jgi:hypothetical protein
MTSREVQFYLRHRRQVTEWAQLEKRVLGLMRDLVSEHAPDKAVDLLRGESGEAEVDFYVRNRSLITEWDGLQAAAGQALHSALLTALRDAKLDPTEGKKGWTSAMIQFRLGEATEDWNAALEMAWTKQDLLSTRRGYAFPRLALVLHPGRLEAETRSLLANATRAEAHAIGLRRKSNWWVHWATLEGISESQDLETYATRCVAQLQEASARMSPVLQGALPPVSER